MSTDVEKLVNSVAGLVSLPEVAIRVNAMVDDPESSADEIGKVIARDPALSARVLGIANTAMFGFAKEVSTINRAVAVLGTRQIRDLVLTTAATKAFDRIPTDLISVDDFWHHSLYCGLLAKHLAEVAQAPHSETIFMAGLLHDIGHLIMFHKIPEQVNEVLLETLQPGNEMLFQIERRKLGYDHSEVGGALAKMWQLPPILQECIEYHHEPERAQGFPREVLLVHIANRIAALPYAGHEKKEWQEMFSEALLQQAHVTLDEIQTAVLNAQQEEESVRKILFGK